MWSRRQARARTRLERPGQQRHAHEHDNVMRWWIAAGPQGVKPLQSSSGRGHCVQRLVSSQRRSLMRTRLRPQFTHTHVAPRPQTVHKSGVQECDSTSTSHLSNFK